MCEKKRELESKVHITYNLILVILFGQTLKKKLVKQKNKLFTQKIYIKVPFFMQQFIPLNLLDLFKLTSSKIKFTLDMHNF